MRYTPKILDGKPPWYAPTLDMLRRFGLSEMQAEVYYLNVYEGMPYVSIAGRLRRKRQTVANHLTRAKRAIADSAYRAKSCEICAHRAICASAKVGTALKADTCAHHERERKS